MSLEPWGDIRSSTSWSSHSCDNHGVNYVSKWVLVIFSVVPASLINKLSQDFNRWLRTIFLLLGHIKIINKNYASHAKSRTEMVFSALIEFHVHDVLDLVAMGLGRESNFNDEPCRRIKLV